MLGYRLFNNNGLKRKYGGLKVSCNGCPSYNKGRGTKACLKCPDQPDPKIPQPKPGPRIINMQAETIEDIAEMIPKSTRDILKTLDPKDSTMLLQSIILGMTHQEIAEYHLYRASKTVQRKINISLDIIRFAAV